MRAKPTFPVPLLAGVLCLSWWAGGCGLEPVVAYRPVRAITRTPANDEVGYEQVTIVTPDGLILCAWYMPPRSPDGPVILDCHGAGVNLTNRVGFFVLMQPLGAGVLAFDYRGFGLSEGTPNENALYRDAMTAWDYLVNVRGIDPRRIVLHGHSLGGAVAAWLADRVGPAGLILESSFTSLTDSIAEIVWFLPIRLIFRQAFGTREYLSKTSCPVLIVHSREDPVVPFHHAQDLLLAVKGPRELLEISGDHYNGIFSSPRYVPTVREFLRRCVPAR